MSKKVKGKPHDYLSKKKSIIYYVFSTKPSCVYILYIVHLFSFRNSQNSGQWLAKTNGFFFIKLKLKYGMSRPDLAASVSRT